eukprot:gene31607-18530_t
MYSPLAALALPPPTAARGPAAAAPLPLCETVGRIAPEGRLVPRDRA